MEKIHAPKEKGCKKLRVQERRFRRLKVWTLVRCKKNEVRESIAKHATDPSVLSKVLNKELQVGQLASICLKIIRHIIRYIEDVT